VYRGTYHGADVAVKEMGSSTPDVDEVNMHRYVLDSATVIVRAHSLASPGCGLYTSALRDPHVVQMHGAVYADAAGTPRSSPLLVMEYCRFGDLDKLLQAGAVWLTPAIKVRLMKEVAEGMAYLHRRRPVILHLDLKPKNILVRRRCNHRRGPCVPPWTHAQAADANVWE
jgi:serine/threonine protein kinase